LRADLSQRGLARARQFTFEKLTVRTHRRYTAPRFGPPKRHIAGGALIRENIFITGAAGFIGSTSRRCLARARQTSCGLG
jgi:hypothetical protein